MKKYKFLYITIIIILFLIPVINGPFNNKLIKFGSYSDTYSDANVLMAGNHFRDYGFKHLYFLPTKGPISIEQPYEFYTHYPPLPDIINGFFKSIGIDQIWFYKCFSYLISITGLYFLFLILEKLFNRIISLTSVLLILISPSFIFYSVSLHQHPYNWFFRFGSILLFINHIDKEKFKKIRLFILWILLFFSSLNSFEFIIYLQTFFILYSLLIAKMPTIRMVKLNLLTISAPFFGFLVHIYQNALAIGGKKAIFDIFYALIYRTIGINKTEINDPPFSLINGLKSILIKLIYSFTEPGKIGLLIIFIFLLVFILLSKKKKIINFQLLIIKIFILSSITWSIFLFQHASVHFHIINQFLPVPQLIISIILYNVYTKKDKNRLLLYVTILNFLCYLVFNVNTIFYYKNNSVDWSKFSKYKNINNEYFYSNRYKPQMTLFTDSWPFIIEHKDSLLNIFENEVFFLDTLYNDTEITKSYLDSISTYIEDINNYKIYRFGK